ncbi:DUF3301 domain-containing protein [Thiothrix eikelboomii]|uniref:DUF3301 domain-containing protein n=1 Tax=Thiothrix eikelboomii TaxID=92487 RepID=A0A1T4WGF2_9GAMM|nr:DUF3301 domain-containing protein [Thiothrix eikelboomii]SKA75731.1 Protein of unknown function [Thiothrix eikelboomii]
MGIFIFIAGLLALAWFWQDSLKSRERAIRAAAIACREIGAQLLDQTVALKKIKFARAESGQVNLRRIYEFEFSLAGYERLQGRAYVLGQKLEQVQLDRAEGMVIDLKSHSHS